MYKVKIKLKTLTPLFMYGADGSTPEIRVASIKGMLRFWWRAAKAEDDLQQLLKEENEIFGGTGEKEEKKSSIKISATNINEPNTNIRKIYALEFNYNQNKKCLVGKHAGLGYLLYSTVYKNKEKSYFDTEKDFELIISSYNEKKLKISIAALWLSVYLGGFGTRARRGGGNLEIIKIDTKSTNIDLDLVVKEKNTLELNKWLIENTKKAIKIINDEDSILDFSCRYSNLSILRTIISNNSFNSWINALNDIGTKFMKFRVYNKSDRLNIASFGLPSKHVKVKSKDGNINRRNSPLIFKILKTDNKYYWTILRLPGKYLPDNAVLKKGNETQKPDYSLIEEFWYSLRNSNTELILNQPKRLIDIKNRLIKDLNPSKIILFGSKARGDFSKRSDIDIAIETENPLSGSNIHGNLDIIKLDKNTDKNLKNKIEKEGVIIYERKS